MSWTCAAVKGERSLSIGQVGSGSDIESGDSMRELSCVIGLLQSLAGLGYTVAVIAPSGSQIATLARACGGILVTE